MAESATTRLPRRESANQRRCRLNVQKGHCTWCQGPVPKGRRYWCSKVCVDEFRVVNDPEHLRRKLLERDHGICAICGVNTQDDSWKALRRFVESMRVAAGLCYVHHANESRWLERTKELNPWGWWRKRKSCTCFFCVLNREIEEVSTWQADHIRPVCEGGGQVGLSGYRTLCWGCHKRETAKLAGRQKKNSLFVTGGPPS